jgi:hypothetical protein
MSKTTCNKTQNRVKQLLKERNGLLPVWIRAPIRGPEFFTGFSRAKLYQLAADGLIKTKSIKEPGKERGTRLFNLPSILAYIDSVPDEQIETEAA